MFNAKSSKKSKPRTDRVDSLIGQQSRVLGDLLFSGGLHVDGTVQGNVRAEDDSAFLNLSDKGTIEGEVHVPIVHVNGLVRGDVYASERVELASSARVEGNVYYKLIEMAMGAEVNGQLVRMTEDADVPLALRGALRPEPETQAE
jgi:cytoskeletal protein CcmA (bactofilin family)